MRTRGRDIFETLGKENWQDAVRRWILRLRNKNQKAEHRLGELSTVAEDPCSGAGVQTFSSKDQRAHRTGW